MIPKGTARRRSARAATLPPSLPGGGPRLPPRPLRAPGRRTERHPDRRGRALRCSWRSRLRRQATHRGFRLPPRPVAEPSSRTLPSQTARARPRSDSARARGRPTAVRSASASLQALGGPNCSTRRAASVLAPRTVTCCPRIARTANSKGSQLPGSRSPPDLGTIALSAGDFLKWAAISLEFARRSKKNRICSTAGRNLLTLSESIFATRQFSRAF